MPSSNNSSASKNASVSVTGTLAWFVVVGVSYVILLSILAGPHFFGHRLKAGDIAESDLVAPRKTMVVDEEKTQELREAARHRVIPVLRRDANRSAEIVKAINLSLEKIKSIQSKGILPFVSPPQLSAQEQVALLELPRAKFDEFLSALSSGSAESPVKEPLVVAAFNKIHSIQAVPKAHGHVKTDKTALSLPQYLYTLKDARQDYEQVKPAEKNLEHQILLLAASIKPESLADYLSDLSSAVQRLVSNVSLQPNVERHEWETLAFAFLPEHFDPALRKETASFISAQLQPNVVLDQAGTDAQIKQAISTITPVMKEIDTGSVIVQKGEQIKTEELRTLESMGITEVSDPGLASAIAIALFSAFLLFGLYLHTYDPKLFFSPSALALMSTVSIISCIAAFFLGQQYPQFVPLPAATLILAVTYGRRLTGILTMLIVLFMSVSELLAGAHLVAIGTAAGMALGASIKRRRDLMVTGILVGFMQALGYTSAVLLGGSPAQAAGLGVDLPVEMLGGLISAIAAIGSLPFLENIFGILTPYRVAELAEPDQPLMRQLEENAPGTYQHSLAVANLAEGGARAIGADVNLVHTGAMYHDIGKMVTPRYFIENQLGDKNPHDFIPPEESRAKVLAHVTNGLALAQKYGLPKQVQAFIPEHQGTTIMAYFYHKACVRDGADNVDPLNYRYPGPKPQTKESAIVMLADVSEAVTHSMHDPTMEEVEAAISSVFKARWEDGQFDESGLTADELQKVKRGFVRVWRTLHHDRLKYPSTTTGKMAIVPAEVAQGSAQSTSQSSTPGAVAAPEKTESSSMQNKGEASEWDC
jgi:putative nucleotidyltransferase with HDIG domain